ncbi:MAG: alpha/beta hydrolase, partial [Pyrinomonadaceae bacterium]
LYPLLTAFQTAREKNVSLSFARYFDGLTGEKSNIQFKTYVYKRAGETELKLDVYAPPEGIEANGAGIVVIHGGSWSAGERSDFPQWNAWLAANGFTIFDIDYTLAPQPNYAAAIDDVKCAVRYVKAHGAELNVAPGRIALLGRSAGGHLALTAAYTANDGQISCGENDSANDETVRAVVSFYAPTDLVWAYDNPANQLVIDGPRAIANFIGGSPRESDEISARFALASPIEKVNANSPPTLLIHGGRDQVVRGENLDILDEKLKQTGVARETLVIPYAQHGFDYNFNGFGSQIAKPVILDFLIKNTQN